MVTKLTIWRYWIYCSREL